MYGLINKAIPEWVKATYGAELWNAIKAKGDGIPDEFIGLVAYDDALTYQLVTLAAESTGLSVEEVIEQVGEYWISYTANESHANFLRFAGTSFKEFLKNANPIHARLHQSMPDMNMPEFFLLEEEERSVLMQYFSERKGLFPMVQGVVHGLAKRFNHTCTVTLVEDLTEKNNGIIFRVAW
jgi:hypothetical protein